MSDTTRPPENAHTFIPVGGPPPSARSGRHTGGTYIPAFEFCRQNPGQWVKLGKRLNGGTTKKIKNGIIKGCEPGEFEAVARETKRGVGDIYIRYVGHLKGQVES